MRVNKRRGDRSIHKEVRTSLSTLICDGCGEIFYTGLGGTRATSSSDVVTAAHANGWNVADPDTPYCPECCGRETQDDDMAR